MAPKKANRPEQRKTETSSPPRACWDGDLSGVDGAKKDELVTFLLQHDSAFANEHRAKLSETGKGRKKYLGNIEVVEIRERVKVLLSDNNNSNTANTAPVSAAGAGAAPAAGVDTPEKSDVQLELVVSDQQALSMKKRIIAIEERLEHAKSEASKARLTVALVQQQKVELEQRLVAQQSEFKQQIEVLTRAVTDMRQSSDRQIHALSQQVADLVQAERDRARRKQERKEARQGELRREKEEQERVVPVLFPNKPRKDYPAMSEFCVATDGLLSFQACDVNDDGSVPDVASVMDLARRRKAPLIAIFVHHSGRLSAALKVRTVRALFEASGSSPVPVVLIIMRMGNERTSVERDVHDCLGDVADLNLLHVAQLYYQKNQFLQDLSAEGFALLKKLLQ